MRSRHPSPQEEASRRLAELDWWGDEVPPARRAEPAGPPVDGVAPASPPRVPVPGRHAAPARRARLVGALVPESLRGRASLGSAQLTVVALLVAAGLAVTAWLVVRGDPEPVREVLAAGASAAPLVPLSTGEAGPTSPAGVRQSDRITVDVEGKVRRPGIAVLDAGARVIDALEAAGGARPGVDTSGLNLARVLVDGEQILVGVGPPPAAVAAAPSGGADAAPGQLVNLNTATVAELETLPEVGPVTAEAIIAWRDQHGGFSSVDELLEVDGIGDKTLATIAPHVTV